MAEDVVAVLVRADVKHAATKKVRPANLAPFTLKPASTVRNTAWILTCGCRRHTPKRKAPFCFGVPAILRHG